MGLKKLHSLLKVLYPFSKLKSNKLFVDGFVIIQKDDFTYEIYKNYRLRRKLNFNDTLKFFLRKKQKEIKKIEQQKEKWKQKYFKTYEMKGEYEYQKDKLQLENLKLKFIVVICLVLLCLIAIKIGFLNNFL